MNDFSMTAAYNRYCEARIRLEHIKTRIEGLQTQLLYTSEEDQGAVLAELEAARAELQAAEQEADNLWCKANFGKSRQDIPVDGRAQYRDYFGNPVKMR